MIHASYYAGIDVSKPYLDLHLLPTNLAKRFPNTAAGHRQLIALLKKHPVKLIVLEASGGYEHAAVVAMVNAGLAVFVAQPQLIRDFVKSFGQRAKNDQIDAAMLACYAMERGNRLTPITRIDPTQETLQALVVRRDQLVQMRTMEENRRQQALDKLTLQSIKRSIAYLEKEIARIEKTIDAMIQADPVLKAKSDKMQETKGIGPQTTRLLLACLPEVGTAGPKRLNSLVGVAPYPEISGNKDAPRHIAGGRKIVRDGLYMACISAAFTNPVIASSYRSLRKRGLAHKSAMMACIRRMLAHLDKQIGLLMVQLAASPAQVTEPA